MMTFKEFCKLHKIEGKAKKAFKEWLGVTNEELTLSEREWFWQYHSWLREVA